MSDGIVEYGRHIFEDYYAKEKELRDDLLQNIADYGAGQHNISVFLCFCEGNKELTYSIFELSMQQSAEESLKGFKAEDEHSAYLSITVMMFINFLTNHATSYDRAFNCNIFFPMIVKTWKNVWSLYWTEFLDQIYKKHEKFKFESWKPVIEKLKQLS